MFDLLHCVNIDFFFFFIGALHRNKQSAVSGQWTRDNKTERLQVEEDPEMERW